jgi:hypothetical protein
MIYTKFFWSTFSFEENNCQIEFNIDILYKFIYHRLSEIIFIPFLNINFRLNNKDNYKCNFIKNSLLSYDTFVNKKIKESFNLLKNE